ncbi:alkaline phosphatase family protein [Tautonia sociabilis]|uniref:alkaline phosphatase family protein n=1 Tax=Tautonia sociabilis TaxID=2080755 RepID=UPI0013154AF6|nr:alkaline phosphatase family protein [Tautonia sociabilis]
MPRPLIASSPHIRSGKFRDKVVVLGFDGMDPMLVTRMMDNGELPNFQRLAARGGFQRLRTTMPPQSPVAWSSFITGAEPGGHGIYDFIHRDAASFMPYLSTSRSISGSRSIEIGDWVIPLESGRVDLMRRGTPFWDALVERDIPVTVYALPANFPIEHRSDSLRALSGMGTPDLLGGYGRYTLFTERPLPEQKRSGGRVELVRVTNHVAKGELQGPKSPFERKPQPISIPVTMIRDPRERVIKIDIGGQVALLKEGEWSEWIPVSFDFIPLLASMSGAVRCFVKQVHPFLSVYISPVQIDPMDPAMPICNPIDYSQELAENIGRFYTQGLPADTKALSEGVLDSYEFLRQGKIVFAENLAAFDYEFARFKEGCFVFYFSSTDQMSHMLMRCMDPKHPLYEPDAVQEVKDAIRFFYRGMDEVVGRVLDRVDSTTTVLVLSDHGFAPFTREINLSTWLVQEGFTAVTDQSRMHEMDFYQLVDWQNTSAYALGINGIYLNLKGREKRGTLPESEAQRVKSEIIRKLHDLKDPLTGKRVVMHAYDSSDLYSGPFASLAPDIQVGYASGYRVSDESILGGFPAGIVRDRKNPWASDHCMDPRVVPGILFSNRTWKTADPAIWDLAPTILREFGISAPRSMTGQPLRA